MLFHTDPAEFPFNLHQLISRVRNEYSRSTSENKKSLLRFVLKLCIDLGSFLSTWHLDDSIGAEGVKRAHAHTSELLGQLERIDRGTSAEIIAQIFREHALRFKVEGCDGDTAREAAQKLAEKSLMEYSARLIDELRRSNLRAMAERTFGDRDFTELGNDYAAFLQQVIWLGGSFVTTNPVLIKLAWELDPDYWNGVVDRLISNQQGDGTKTPQDGQAQSLQHRIQLISSLLTMEVVKENCRLLRDIFLATGGQRGYVSLQVNPGNHNDAELMVREAESIYEELTRHFNGIPNIVIKIPATHAGLKAAELLTSKGIGVTVTVNFSVFQSAGFGAVLKESRALVSYIALMNGRLAFPVRDELIRNDIRDGEQAARWAGVEVARKSYRRLYASRENGGLGLDPGRVKLLIASLRIYDDRIPDISELWGSPVITIFPNVRRAFDIQRRELSPRTVHNSTPSEALAVLKKSEIFKQAWFGPSGPPADRPNRPLSLNAVDSQELLRWQPVAETMKQFIEQYREMGRMIEKRIRLQSPQSGSGRSG